MRLPSPIGAQKHWFRVTNAPAEMNEVIQTDASFVVFFLQSVASASADSDPCQLAAVSSRQGHR